MPVTGRELPSGGGENSRLERLKLTVEVAQVEGGHAAAVPPLAGIEKPGRDAGSKGCGRRADILNLKLETALDLVGGVFNYADLEERTPEYPGEDSDDPLDQPLHIVILWDRLANAHRDKSTIDNSG